MSLSERALVEWTHHAEQIVRGLTHALNNRAAALSAIIELSREPDDDPDATRGILQTELGRVRELASAIRVLGPAPAETDAFSPADVIPDVEVLLRVHAEQRDRLLEFACTAPPVRVSRRDFQRALIVLCAGAPSTDPAKRRLGVVIDGEGGWLVARVAAPSGQPAVMPSAFVAEVVASMDGELLPGGFRLPTLEEVRRREGR